MTRSGRKSRSQQILQFIFEHLLMQTVVVTEAFNGKVKQFKNAVVVATR